jgi:Flp pilus assembly secretin CpaC
MKPIIVGVLALILLSSVTDTTAAREEKGIAIEEAVPTPIAVAVNKAQVIRLPRKAKRVSVTQPQIAQVEILAPDLLVVHGKAVGSTSLVVWFEQPGK